jgi:hypothetical protein
MVCLLNPHPAGGQRVRIRCTFAFLAVSVLRAHIYDCFAYGPHHRSILSLIGRRPEQHHERPLNQDLASLVRDCVRRSH